MNRGVVVALLLLSCGLATSAPLQEKFEKTYPLAPNATITVRNTDGTIYIYGSEVNELKIFARKKAYSKERLDGISINVSINGDQVGIDTIYPPGPKGLSLKDRSGTVDYIIIVPETSSLSQVELTNGEIIVDGLRGPAVNARLTNGIILAGNCFSAVHLNGFARRNCGRLRLVGSGKGFAPGRARAGCRPRRLAARSFGATRCRERQRPGHEPVRTGARPERRSHLTDNDWRGGRRGVQDPDEQWQH